MKTAAALLIAGLVLAPLAAEAQSFRCVGKDGKKYYGQAIPPQCLGLPVEELNSQGMVVKRYDAQASAADRAKKEADEEDRKKRELVAKEEGRRNRALLATYTSDKDIDDARKRALLDNEAAVKDIERRIAGLKTHQAELQKELDFYQGKNKPPAKLNNDIQNMDFDIQTQQGLLASKKKDVDTINARYDDDKKRYVELTKSTK